MSAQGPDHPSLRRTSGEQRRFREVAASHTPVPMRYGGTSKNLPSGTYLEQRRNRSAASSSHPFKVRPFQDGGSWKFRIVPGTYNSNIPTLDAVPLNEEPEGVLGSGPAFVYLKVCYELNEENNYVYSGTIETSEIIVESEEVDNPLGPFTVEEGLSIGFKILIASFEDGVKSGQYVISSLSGEICGVADDSGKANLLIVQA